MSRRFLAAVAGLSATVGLLLGLLVAGSLTPTPAVSGPTVRLARAREVNAGIAAPAVSSFADVAERINPAVVNVDATSRGGGELGRSTFPSTPERPDLFVRPGEADSDGPQRGTGSGFIIDAQGHVLTNYHVVAAADRLTVRLANGRSFSARRVGADPDTDIALLKVDASGPLPFAPLGDSDALRVGEWVVAIGNSLAYEHTVTVGVVSFIGRKLFNPSLDRYIQTDAAINFGNSGGPLIDARGDVVGITSAISSRTPTIGFAVPINQAVAILPQLLATGHVSRGYIGVGPRDVDPDLQRSLHLHASTGALVQDVTAGSPGARAGIRIYDLIVAVDGKAVSGSDQLIQIIAARLPGTVATLQVMRGDRPITIPVKLAERPSSDGATDPAGAGGERPRPSVWSGATIGVSVRGLDREFAVRSKLPDDVRGVVVSRVEPMSPAFDAQVKRGDVVIEVNREPVHSVAAFQRAIADTRAGDVLTFHLYNPKSAQRTLQTVRIE